jgi:fumarate hydratase class II
LATAFVPVIGYDRAASLAKEAYEKNKTIREVAVEKGVLPEQEIQKKKGVLPEQEIQKILNILVGKDETP